MKKEKLRVAHWGGSHLLYLPFNLAMELGYFSELGLEVSAYAAGNDQEVLGEVLRKRADIGIGDPSFVASDKKRSCRVIGTLVQTVSSYGVSHYPEINFIAEAADCAALRFATYPQPSTSFALLSSIKKRHQHFLKTMELVETPIGEQLQALERAQAEVLVGIEPLISYAEHLGLRLVFSGKTFFPEFLFSGIYSRVSTIEEKPKVLISFLRGLNRALKETGKVNSKAREIAFKMFPDLPRSCLENALKRLNADSAWPSNTVINPKAWQNCLNLRRELNENWTGEKIETGRANELLESSLAMQALV